MRKRKIMKFQKLHFFLFIAVTVVFLPIIACKTVPPAVDAGESAPDQIALDRLNAAEARAQSGREKALGVRGQVHFPDEWTKAESDNNAGKNANKDTLNGVNEAIAFFENAADGYEAIAEKSGPLFARETEDARNALEAAAARAEQSRKNASDNQGQRLFPNDWRTAETSFQNGEDAAKDTPDEINAAAALYTAAADGFDDIAERSAARLAREKEDADRALQAAMARADQSRKNAQDVRAQTFFPDEWRTAEAGMQSGRSARKNTTEEIKAATTLYTAAARGFDDIAARSRPLLAMDDARKELAAAITRMERSRQQAVNAGGETYFPNDWRTAESRNQAGRNAPQNTADEIKAAAAQIVSAADAYDDIANRSGPKLAQDRDEANKALQAAIARAAQSRRDAAAVNGQTNFPDEWKTAEERNQTAGSARKTTPAEMRASVPLYNQAADAYDIIVRRNTERVAAAERRRREAEDILTRAREISSESVVIAANAEQIMERRHE